MLGIAVALIHLFIAVFYSFYSFIVPSIFLFDYCYFVFLIVLQISWIVFNHECPVSYFYKALHYPNYKCGETTTLDDFKEITHLFSGSESKTDYKPNYYGELSDSTLTLFLMISIMIAGYRSKIANLVVIFILFIGLRIVYQLLNNAVGWDSKKFLGKERYIRFKKWYVANHVEKIREPMNTGIIIIMLLFFVYITYVNRKRLYY